MIRPTVTLIRPHRDHCPAPGDLDPPDRDRFSPHRGFDPPDLSRDRAHRDLDAPHRNRFPADRDFGLHRNLSSKHAQKGIERH